MVSIAEQRKAILGGILAALTALGTILTGDHGFADVTAGQWIVVAIAALGTYATVYGVSNAQGGNGKHEAP